MFLLILIILGDPLYLKVEELDLLVSALHTNQNNQELFEINTNMVASIAGYYAKKCVPFLQYQELYQWGLIGLWDACRKWRGTRDEFKYYARRRIKGHIIDEIRNSTPLRRKKKTMSGVMPKFDTLEPNIVDSGDSPVDELVHARVELRKVIEALSLLTKKEALIISMYCFEDYKLREIADYLGVTEAYICQVKDKALDQLARASSAGLDP